MKTLPKNGQRIVLFALLLLKISSNKAQIRISPVSGTIDGSASLEVTSGPYSSGSPYRGLLVPTLNATQRGQIQNPAKGLLIFNTSANQMEVNTGSPAAPSWTPGGATSGGTSPNAWFLSGNSGTTPTANFLGTTDLAPLRFRVNNQNAGRIDASTNNVALGYLALNNGTTGTGNTALGTLALAANTSSSYNTAIGLQTLTSNTTGTGNTALGTVALLSNTSGNFNTATGYNALNKNSTGTGNTATGAVTLQENTSGANNTAMGQVALQSNTTGSRNTALGAGSLQRNTTGYENQAIGHNAAAGNTTGYSNTALGTDALVTNTEGHDNVALGGSALLNNTTGGGNVASGNLALSANLTGQSNTAVGTIALRYNTTGNYNTALGVNAGPLQANAGLNNATAIGANAVVGASNEIVLGDFNITALRCNVQTLSTLSDQRIKEDVRANVPGLSFITRLTPVTYHVNKRKEAQLVGYSLAHVQEDRVVHSGFLAQEVEAAAKAVGYPFEGVRQEENGKYYTVGYTLFVIPLVQAVKDLHKEITDLKGAINQLKSEVTALKDKENTTQVRLAKLEALIEVPARYTTAIAKP